MSNSKIILDFNNKIYSIIKQFDVNLKERIINKYADMQDDKSSSSAYHKIWDWRFNCVRHFEYKRLDYFKMMNIYTELSTIPELRTKDYKDFRRTLRDALEDMPTDDE